MSSNIIYTSEKVLPYVYICTHKETGQFYIGYRQSNKIPSHLDLPKYRTSSKIVKPNFEKYEYQIIAEFFNSEEAFWFEQNLIETMFSNPLCINGQYVKRKTNNKAFRRIGPLSEEHIKKINKNKFGRRHSQDTKLKLSKIVHDSNWTRNNSLSQRKNSKKFIAEHKSGYSIENISFKEFSDLFNIKYINLFTGVSYANKHNQYYRGWKFTLI